MNRLPFSFWVVFLSADLGFVLTLLLGFSSIAGLPVLHEPMRALLGIPILAVEFLLFLGLEGVALLVMTERWGLLRAHYIFGALSFLGIGLTGYHSALEMLELFSARHESYALFIPSSIIFLCLFMVAFVASALAFASRPR